ncbi:MAG TPA: methionine--tRNA ligase [Kofleriaceae bacterium]|nr:methionine--tRNA ligase [Kofleriaceae bacterium]
MSRFYITTPIYYVNDVPHLGHAYTTIVADALARFHRAVGDDTRFLTGTDEHGLKVEQAAAARGLEPKALADQVVERFRATWSQLDIANDDFIRTTDERHKQVVSEIWRRMEAAGDIYEGAYEGWYCVACEAYYPEGELLEGRLCPTHKREATWLSEPTYFFRMSRYQDRLLEHFDRHPGFVQPEGYKNEVVSFVKSGLRDLSVSRTTFKWGIPVPGDERHVIYVWIDALTNYMSALGPIDGELHRRFWPATCHLIGKDILKFHAVYWPCMLMSANLPLPETIFTHGWWTVRGEKISKSMPATRVDPNQLGADIGVDAVRYYLLREVPLGLDGDFTYENLIARYNAELAQDFGNLVSRTVSLTSKFAGGQVPAPVASLLDSGRHAELARVAREVIEEAAGHMRAYAPSKALTSIWRLVGEGNRYVQDMAPWVMARDPSRKQELGHVLRMALEVLCATARMVAPAMPATAERVLATLGMDGARNAEATARWPSPERFGRELELGASVAPGEPLFPRIDDARQAVLLDRWIPPDARRSEGDAQAAPAAGKKDGAGARSGKGAGAAAGAGAGARGEVTFEEFSRMDLRVAVVLEAEPVPKAKKLLKLLVDVGEAEPRQVVAGIAEAFEPAALVGRRVIFLANLKPATIRGVTSQGMILAAGEEAVLGLSAVDRELPAGTRIR